MITRKLHPMININIARIKAHRAIRAVANQYQLFFDLVSGIDIIACKGGRADSNINNPIIEPTMQILRRARP